MARLVQNGAVVEESALSYAGEESTYAGELTLSVFGAAELEVLAMDPTSANFGQVVRELRVHP